ncbi:MAG: alpha/beta hydrolase [Actinomycetota bacterium]
MASRRKWAARLLSLVVVLGVSYAGLVILEDRFIYFPAGEITATPADAGLEFEDVTFDTEDGLSLHGWWVPGGERSATLLWFHGNAGNLSDRVGLLELLHHELDIGVFVFDYRGYGSSEGKPSEEGLYADARTALEATEARAGVRPEEIVLFGQSLGAAVAVELASAHPVRGVVLEAAFTSIPEMARHHYGYLPVWPFLKTGFDSETRIARIDAPLLMLHGENDDIVPIDMGRRVYDAANEPKKFSLVEGAGHNDVYLTADYITTLRGFLEALGASE